MAAKESVTEAELCSWVENWLKDDKCNFNKIQIVGKTSKTDGYSGKIVFVDVSRKENEALHLVVKHSIRGAAVRLQVPIRKVYEREIFFYDTIIKVFNDFQDEKNVPTRFEALPKCYKTFLFPDIEVLILDSLRQKGYRLYDRKKPLNFEHVKLAFTEYGKLHALSFALKDQKRELFDKLTVDYTNAMADMTNNSTFKETMDKRAEKACEVLQETGNLDLIGKLKVTVAKGTANVLKDLFMAKEAQAVIVHADCWNNNFLFQYKDENQNSPLRISILDWQISNLHSPAYDLSCLLYTSCSTEEFERFDELLQIYYSSLSNFLTSLGSDSQKLFTFEDLRKHWKQYSAIGMIIAMTFLQNTLCEEDEAPDMGNITDDKTFGEVFAIEIRNQELFKERLVAVMKHYYHSLN